MRKYDVPYRVIMRISGHKTLRMLYRYDKIYKEYLGKVVNHAVTCTATRQPDDKTLDMALRRRRKICNQGDAPVAQPDRAADF